MLYSKNEVWKTYSNNTYPKFRSKEALALH